MKQIIIVITILGFCTWVYLASQASNRAYNARMCALTMDKDEDCTTPLTKEQKLCNDYYGYGYCDRNGEVKPEYTKEVINNESKHN